MVAVSDELLDLGAFEATSVGRRFFAFRFTDVASNR
jgi:hypothetical protein